MSTLREQVAALLWRFNDEDILAGVLALIDAHETECVRNAKVTEAAETFIKTCDGDAGLADMELAGDHLRAALAAGADPTPIATADEP